MTVMHNDWAQQYSPSMPNSFHLLLQYYGREDESQATSDMSNVIDKVVGSLAIMKNAASKIRDNM